MMNENFLYKFSKVREREKTKYSKLQAKDSLFSPFIQTVLTYD